MSRSEDVMPPEGGALAISVLGGILAISGIWHVLFVVFGNAQFSKALIELTMVGLPGIMILYGGYWLSRSEIPVGFHRRVAGWSLAGLATGSLIIGTAALLPAPVDNPLRVGKIFGTFGALAGLGIGLHNAQTRLRTRELEATIEELEATNDRLETSNERLEQFAYAASHDLQEPLRMVSSYLQLIENRADDELTDETREFLEFAVDGADRMRGMIDSLLEYSRITTGGDPLEPTDAEAVLDDVLDDLQARIEETDAAITCGDLPTVAADPDQLAQLFQNLISNALTYSGEEPPQVHVDAERADGEWRFSVADEGIGIDPDYHDRIFVVFERLSTDEEASETGAEGLGLALCTRIVERHGGEIWVESEPGEGATFFFTISTPENQKERQSAPAVESPTR